MTGDYDNGTRHYAYVQKQAYRKAELEKFFTTRHFPVLRYRKPSDNIQGVHITPKPKRPYTFRKRNPFEDQALFLDGADDYANSPLLTARATHMNNEHWPKRSQTAPLMDRPVFRPANKNSSDSRRNIDSVFTNTPYDEERARERQDNELNRSRWLVGPFKPASICEAKRFIQTDAYLYSADSPTKKLEKKLLKEHAKENLTSFKAKLAMEIRPKTTRRVGRSRSVFPSKYDD